jgi:hypothetical protein
MSVASHEQSFKISRLILNQSGYLGTPSEWRKRQQRAKTPSNQSDHRLVVVVVVSVATGAGTE